MAGSVCAAQRSYACSKGLTYPESGVQTFFYEPAIAPGEMHFDVLFFYDVVLNRNFEISLPPWYASLEWVDMDALSKRTFARQHEDVVSAWLSKKGTRFPAS